jgi:hypothetical protein
MRFFHDSQPFGMTRVNAIASIETHVSLHNRKEADDGM